MVYGGKWGIKMEIGKFYKRPCQLCYHTMIRSEIVTLHTSVDFLFLRCLVVKSKILPMQFRLQPSRLVAS